MLLPPPGPHMASWEPVAQPVEHLTFNQGVSGSNPDGLTILFRRSGHRFAASRLVLKMRELPVATYIFPDVERMAPKSKGLASGG